MVSIIIPTFNRARHLRRTLSSVYAQTSLTGVEIIVVDNGSTDDTRQVCESFTRETPQLTYTYDAMPGLLTGRHRGASLAAGEILCFLDDDVHLDPAWLTSVKKVFDDPEVQLATGPSLPEFETPPPGWLQYFWFPEAGGGKSCPWLSLLDLGPHMKIIHPNYVWGLNFCIRKKALQALGGFHPDCIPAHLQMFQGDGETGLTLKAHRLGYKSMYHPGIKVYHFVTAERLSVDYFKKRAFYQGVCNSFTQLKNLNSGEKASAENKSLRSLITRLVQRVKLATARMPVPKDVRAMKRLLEDEELQGFNYHQNAARTNDLVRQWISKKDYWEFTLPSRGDESAAPQSRD